MVGQCTIRSLEEFYCDPYGEETDGAQEQAGMWGGALGGLRWDVSQPACPTWAWLRLLLVLDQEVALRVSNSWSSSLSLP